MARSCKIVDHHDQPMKSPFHTSVPRFLRSFRFASSMKIELVLPTFYLEKSFTLFFFLYTTSLPLQDVLKCDKIQKLNLKRNLGASLKKMYKVTSLVFSITKSQGRSLKFKNHDHQVKVLKLKTDVLIRKELNNDEIDNFISLSRISGRELFKI